jgi:hypothetical protein
MATEKWQLFRLFPTCVEADRIATFLQSSGVPAYVDNGALGVGLEGEFKVFVASELAHRARWLVALPEIPDAELDFLATGQLPNTDE